MSLVQLMTPSWWIYCHITLRVILGVAKNSFWDFWIEGRDHVG